MKAIRVNNDSDYWSKLDLCDATAVYFLVEPNNQSLSRLSNYLGNDRKRYISREFDKINKKFYWDYAITGDWSIVCDWSLVSDITFPGPYDELLILWSEDSFVAARLMIEEV